MQVIVEKHMIQNGWDGKFHDMFLSNNTKICPLTSLFNSG